MKRLASDVLAVAVSQIGVKESPANSNKQKYGEAYGWNGVPWCMQFVWWVFREAGYAILFYDGAKTAYCPDYVKWAKKNSTWITKDYKPGDIAFMSFDGTQTAGHTGIVESVTESGLNTIEGNTSGDNQSNGGAVMRRYRPYKYILGAARPAYDNLNEDGAHAWSKEAREWAILNRIFVGDENGNMRWPDPITREEVAEVLFRFCEVVKK